MKKSKLISFACLLFPVTNIFAQVFVNNTPGAAIKRIEIYPGPASIVHPPDTLIDITFQNDVQLTGLALQSTSDFGGPSFLQVTNPYTSFAIYHCQAATNPTFGETCDGVAFRIESGELCAGLFRYSTNFDNPATVAPDNGCFRLMEIGLRPLPRKWSLEKLTREQLIDMLTGVRPFNPSGPICLTCPPWPSYEKDISAKFKQLGAKKFKIEVKEIK